MKPKFINNDIKDDVLKWRCDLERSVIEENMIDREWEEVIESDDFNFGWINIHLIKKLFHPSSRINFKDHQVLNHFPNHFELTRKDLLVMNIRRYKRDNNISYYNLNDFKIPLNIEIIPETYFLPSEQKLFQDSFIQSGQKPWIFKPSGKSQGNGIQIITTLNQVRSINSMIANLRMQSTYSNEQFIVSRYINNPLLINKKKFDLRTYVLVTSYKPLKIWYHELGFARFCFEDYKQISGIERSVSMSENSSNNIYSHLTNVSLQKKFSGYNDKHGGKFPLKSFMLYIEMNYGKEVLNKIIINMYSIYITSLKSVKPIIFDNKHCFELYGFDLMIDDNFKVWLIEVNACPSMVATTKLDKRMKKTIINDLVNVVIPKYWLKDRNGGANTCKEDKVGGFSVIYDENNDTKTQEIKRPKSLIKQNTNSNKSNHRFSQNKYI